MAKTCCFFCLKYYLIAALTLSILFEAIFVGFLVMAPQDVCKTFVEMSHQREHHQSVGHRDNHHGHHDHPIKVDNQTDFNVTMNDLTSSLSYFHNSSKESNWTKGCEDFRKVRGPITAGLAIDLVASVVGFYGVMTSNLWIVCAMSGYAFAAMVMMVILGKPGSFLFWFVITAIHANQIHQHKKQKRYEEQMLAQAGQANRSHLSPPCYPYDVSKLKGAQM